MLCAHRQVTFCSSHFLFLMPLLRPKQQPAICAAPASDMGHTWHFSAFAPVSAIKRQMRRSGRLACSQPGQGAARGSKGRSSLPAHGVEALLFGRGSYIVWLRAATDKFLAQTASRPQMQGGAKLMGARLA